MKLIFLYGPPASGKLTVAQELTALTAYRLFHNHLVVDTLLSVFDFGSPSFVELRESIWLSVFRHAAQSGLPGLIFTFAPEPTVSAHFIADVQQLARDLGIDLIFIELTCPLNVLRNRLNASSRQKHGKLTSSEIFENLIEQNAFDTAYMPRPALSLDTSQHTPVQAAQAILQSLTL